MKPSRIVKASEEGRGKSKGPRGANPGLQRKAMRRRVTEQRPKLALTPAQIDVLVDVINGDKLITDDEVDDDVALYAQWLDAPPPPKRSGKKAPNNAGN